MRTWHALLLLTVLLPLVAGAQALRYDFEAGTALSAYPNLKADHTDLSVVAEGAPGQGQCLKFSNPIANKYCGIRVNDLGPLTSNLVISFDHRETIEAGKEANYLGVILYCGGQQYFGSDTFSDQWHHCELTLAQLHPTTGGTLRLGQPIESLNLYGRVKGDDPAKMTVWVDNLRLEVREANSVATDSARVSYANPPFFCWKSSGGPQRLEYCPTPDFPRRRTFSVPTTRNFYLPSQPLGAGTWYWRVYQEGELLSGYTEGGQIQIPAEAHQFTTPPVPTDRLAAKAHPRVIPLDPGDGKSRADLLSQFDGYARQGVPDDPPAYAPGNPNWPTWIDWYGKVAGGITGATGRRLQLMAECYARTREPRLRDTLKPLVLKAASWDPNGGSAMKNGDIGAHHLLRGFSWCYDALYSDLTPEERRKLQDVIVARGTQFWQGLNPFRFGTKEFNNHAWLQALALAEAGLVLQGERPEVADWAEYVRELYQGLFLAGLGYQGDNNEGIAYWGYGLSFVIEYADMMRYVCGLDFYQHPWLRQTGRFPMYSALPGGWAVSFGDTGQPNHGLRGPAETAQVRELALRTRDPYALWYSGATGPVDGLTPQPPVDLPQSIHYRFIGWSIFNTSLLDAREDVTLAMRCGKFYAGHQHEDLNGFVLHAYGDKLAVDSGHYDWYGSPHFEKYSVLTRAHNAILVDGKDQDSRKPGADGKMLHWFDSPAYGYMVGEIATPNVYSGLLKRWQRRALFLKPGLILIHDALQATGGKARYDWLLHTVADPKTEATGQSFTVQTENAALQGKFLLPRDLDLKVTKGYPVEPVDRYSTRPVPPERYVWEWTVTATPREPRGVEDFLTALRVKRGQAGPAPRCEALTAQNAVGARVTWPGETHVVLFRKPDSKGALEGGRIQTDGEAAAVMLDERGSVVRLCLLGGTFLRWDGKPLAFTDGATADLTVLTTPTGSLCNVTLSAAGRLSLPVAGPCQEVLVDGEKVVERKGQAGVFPMSLDFGEHQLAWGRAAAQMPSHALPPLRLGEATLRGYAQRQADGLLCAWWGTMTTPAQDLYQIRFSVAPGQPLPAVSLDGRPLPLTADKNSGVASAWLAAGSHFLTLTGRAPLTGAEMTGSKVQGARAVMLPKEFTVPANGTVIEAEKPSAEGEVKGLVVEKVGASQKLAHGTWDKDGQWAEWTFKVAQTGRYNLLIRGASEQTDISRALLLDDKPLTPVGIASFASTGGWCRTTDDWRVFQVCGPDGTPAAIALSAGTHRLRMVRLTGSMNLDWLAWVPAK